MKFNSKKYNIIICVMLILIGLVYFVTASFYSQSWSDTPSNPDNPTPPITNPDVPPIDDTEDENTDGVTQAPVFSNGHDAIKYAVNIINSGIPFIYQFYNTTISADYVKVEAYEKLYRNKNHDLMLVWSDTDASIPGFSSIAKKKGSFFRFAYTNCEETSDRYVRDTTRYNRKEQTYQFIDSDSISGNDKFSEYLITDKTKDWGNFYLTVNKQNSKIVYFDKSDKNNYEIKVSMYPSKINMNDPYITAQTKTTDYVERLEFDYLNLTFIISKKTGRIIRCVREDSYTLVSNIAGISFSCQSSATHLYTYTETEQTIKDLIKENLNIIY